MSNDIEIRIAHSKSDASKVWVTMVLPDKGADTATEFAVGFNENDINEIMQIGEVFAEDLTEEDMQDPLINEARVVLGLACFYPDQFIPDLESRELTTFLDAMPSKFLAPKHCEKVFKQHSDMTSWQAYSSIELAKKSKPSSKPKRYESDESDEVDEVDEADDVDEDEEQQYEESYDEESD